jgi:hypothetical protein
MGKQLKTTKIRTGYEKSVGERRSWMRHSAARREVLDLIPDRVLGKFQVIYSFCLHSVTLGSTQSLAEMSTK